MKKLASVKKRVSLLAILVIMIMTLCSVGVVFANVYTEYKPSKTPGDSQFDFDGNYEPPELIIDGLDTDTQWGNEFLTTFGKNTNASKVKIYRGDTAMFFYFEVQDTKLLTFGETNDDKVTFSDSIEVYIDTKLDGGIKPQNDDYQINLSIHGKTRIMQGSGSSWGNWNGLIDYEFKLNGTLNSDAAPEDTGYSVELMIPYAQIGIEKTSNIGICFGQVDKVNAAGNTAKVDWDWFPWSFGGTIREPQVPNNYIVLKADNALVDRSDLEKPDAVMAGYVKDGSVPVQGVAVNIVGTEIFTTTDVQGYYAFAAVNSEESYKLSFKKSGFYDNSVEYTSDELRESNGGVVVKNISFINSETAPKTTISGTVKNVISGTVSGATVAIDGTTLSATTNASGLFTIANVPLLSDVKLAVSAKGFETTYTYLKKDSGNIGGTTDLEVVDLNRPYAGGMTFGGANTTNMFSAFITRSSKGIEYKLETSTKFDSDEDAQLFVHAGAMGNKPSGVFVWGDGRITKDARPNFRQFDVATSGISVIIDKHTNNEGSTLYVTLPYAFLYGMRASDVFAYSFGSHNSTGWDGFGYDGFVAPETASAYLRIGANNRIYKADNNLRQVIIAGNVGIAGVTVAVDGKNTESDAAGDFTLTIAQPETTSTVTYTKIGYLKQTKQISKSDFDSVDILVIIDIAMAEKKVSITGTVLDGDGVAVQGATITVNDIITLTATTDAEGKFSIADVPTFIDASVKASKTGYTQALKAVDVATLNGDNVKFDVAMTMVSEALVMNLSGKVINLHGNLEGATVTIEGSQTFVTTKADGTFEFENAPLASYNIIITKSGYNTMVCAVDGTGTEVGGALNLGNIDMPLANAVLGKIVPHADAANFVGYVTRKTDAFEFKWVSEKMFTGQLELFIDTKASNEDGARNNTDYLFMLKADKSIAIANFGGGTNTAVTSGMTLSITNVGSVYTVIFNLPYSFFGTKIEANAIISTEVIGISMGQFYGADWKGWERPDLGGSYNNEPFVKPETTKDYIRFDKNNRLYASEGNFEYAITPDGYNLRFGTNIESSAPKADMFSAKASRNAEALTFDFLARGSFTDATEFVMIYLDLPTLGMTPGGWTTGKEDMQIKIYSTGKVFYKIGENVWWNTTSATGSIADVVMTRAEGKTTFSLAISYETMKVDSAATIGFCMRQAADNPTDYTLYDPWFDFFVDGHEDKIDAAGQKSYPRIDNNGAIAFAV